VEKFKKLLGMHHTLPFLTAFFQFCHAQKSQKGRGKKWKKTIFEKKFSKAFVSQILEKHHTRKILYKPCFWDFFCPYFTGIKLR